MRKIATTKELRSELERLLEYAGSHRPSRTVLASEIRALSARVGATIWRSWGNAGEWYVQRFGDQELYFKASGEALKNGNIQGTEVRLELDRPRARPKAKQISVSRANQTLWKAIEAKDVPPAVLTAAG